MFPYVFYYGGQFIQTPIPFSFTPINTPQCLPFSNHMLMFSSPSTSSRFHYSSVQTYEKHLQNNVEPNQKNKTKIQKTTVMQQHLSFEKSPKRIQNPLRNIYTNITNLVLNFIVSKKKVGQLLLNLDPSLVDEKLIQFYKYVKGLKSYFCSYFNFEKMKKLFNGITTPNFQKDYHKIFRKAAKYVLEQKIPLCLLTSKKMSSSLRQEHFRARRTMLSVLKQSDKIDQ